MEQTWLHSYTAPQCRGRNGVNCKQISIHGHTCPSIRILLLVVIESSQRKKSSAWEQQIYSNEMNVEYPVNHLIL